MTASKTILGKRGGGHHNNGTNNNQTLNNIYNASSTTRNFNNGATVLSSALINGVVSNSNKENSNGGSTSANGDYQFVINEIIASPTSSYKILSFLGKGTFGQVVKCWRVSSYGEDLLNRVETVALKILKCHPSYERQAQTEAAVLSQLASDGVAGRFNIVRPYEFFRHKGHACLVFENLDINLYEYLKSRQFKPLQLEHIRVIAQQVLVALAKLKTFGLIHADLKPENIMLVDSVQKPFRVKVIDFGSACFASQAVCPTYLQSRYYRAPEILLGLPYSEAIDMWSLGCVLAELYMGWPLYPGSSEYDQIRFIVHTQGFPRAELLANATKAEQFFNKIPISVQPAENPRALRPANGNPKDFYWALKSPEVAEREMGVKTKETRKYMLHSLRDMQMLGFTSTDIPPTEVNSHLADRACFVDLLETMLLMDSHVRCTPLEALNHPFITLSHLRNLGQSRLFVKSFLLLDTCTHLSPEELDEMPGRRRRLSPFHCIGVVDNLTNKNSRNSSSTGMGYNSRPLNPYNQLVLKYPQHLHSTQAQHVQYTVPPPPPAHQHHINLQPSMHQHHHHLGPLVFTPVEGGSGVGTSQYSSRTHFNLPVRNSSACIQHSHHHQDSSAFPLFEMNSIPYWDGSLTGAYPPEQQMLEQTPQSLNNLCNTFATVSNSSVLAVQTNKSFPTQCLTRQTRGSCQRSLRLKSVAKNNNHSRTRLLQQHLQNSQQQQHLPFDHQEQLRPLQVNAQVSSAGLDVSVGYLSEEACSAGQLHKNKRDSKDTSPSVHENRKEDTCRPTDCANENSQTLSDIYENVSQKVKNISIEEIQKSAAEGSSTSEGRVMSSPFVEELTKLQDGCLVSSLKNLCLVRLDGKKMNPDKLLNGEVEGLGVSKTSARNDGGDAGDSVSSIDEDLTCKKLSFSDSKQETVPLDGIIKLSQPRSAISSAASPLVVVSAASSKSHRIKSAKATRFVNQEPSRSQLSSNHRFNQPAIPSSTMTTQLLPSDVSMAADQAGANLTTNQHLSALPPYHQLNQSAFLMYPTQQQPQQQPDQNQLLNQPGFLFYPPQQQQQSQHFNQPIFNLPPPLQPGRPILAQQPSGSFILFPGLITPEGSPMGHLSPSFYSLNFGGSFIPASNPGMHCGFYALGSPLLGMGNPHLHSHYQPNHQPLQYLYQA